MAHDSLVARLRARARWGTMTSEFEASDRIEWMAASLIEQQADEIATLKLQRDGALAEAYTVTQDRDRLAAENERLRGLLREIPEWLRTHETPPIDLLDRIDAALGEQA